MRSPSSIRLLAPRLASIDTATAKLPAKFADPHYLTPEHRAWRTAVMARARYRCACGDRARYADHIIELRDGGPPLDPANGEALCARCHAHKTHTARLRRQQG